MKCKLCSSEIEKEPSTGICVDCWVNIDCCGLEKL